MELLRYIEVLEECLGRKAEKNLLPLQPGDVPDTYADVEDLVRDVGYKPATPVEDRRRAASSTGTWSTTRRRRRSAPGAEPASNDRWRPGARAVGSAPL